MGRISSSIGLVTGVPIQDTVDKLIALQAQPRDQLESRTETLGKQQTAITELTAKLLALQFTVKNLAKPDVYQQKTATSSNPSLLSTNVVGEPVPGTYVYTPVRAASSQQLLSSAFSSDTAALGAGTFSLQYGGEVDKGVELGLLGGGQGIQRGKIRITDRSGASAEIDLRFATKIDDVIRAVNDAGDVNVTLKAHGDRLVLIDDTGQTTSNLRVEEVGGGSTAATLGLAGIDAAAAEATGDDVLQLYDNMPLAVLLDGRGIRTKAALPDLQVTFRDGSDALSIDFNALARVADEATGTRSAANGADAQLRFTAAEEGADYDGYTISYVDDPTVTAGAETVAYDAEAKTIVFSIDEGATNADHIVAALAADPEAGAHFTAARTDVTNPAGLISVTDGALTTGGAARDAKTEITLGELFDTIESQSGGRLRAELRADGDGIQITDLTEDRGGAFAITSAFDSQALADLGLEGAAVNGVITGERLHGGLKTSMLASLGGGQGLDLGALDLTDRSGATVSIDLSATTTLDELLQTINTDAAAAGVDISVGVNASRTGLQLTDSSGGAGPLIVADGDATNSAEQLGLAVNANVSSLNGESLQRQTVSENTLLASLNGGAGIAGGQFRVTNSAGAGATITINDDVKTVGQLLKEINDRVLDVEARINDAGDGIVLIDQADGEGALVVGDIAGGRTAADLRILGTAQDMEIDGQTQQAIQGGNRFEITLDDDDSLDDMIEKVNSSGAGVFALKMGDGSIGNPFRLSLFGKQAGEQANLVFDTSGVDFSFNETSRGQDALLLFGSAASSSSGLLVSSKSNTFTGLLPGVELEVRGSSTDPVAVQIEPTDDKLIDTAGALVNAFNDIRDKLDDLTFFNPDNNSTGILHGSMETLRIETGLANLVTGRFFGVGSVQTLEAVGIGINDSGKLSLDQAKLEAAFASDPEGVTEFFTKEDLGVADKLDALIEQMAGVDHSMLVTRAGTLATRIESNTNRIAFLNERLESQRERLLLNFYNMELAIGKIQSNMAALDQLQVIPPLGD